MDTTIKFGTDGWRAIIADDFTTENVARVAEATAQWLKKQSKEPKAVIGHDTRFGGELFAETTCKVLAAHGIKCFLAKGFVSTPMVSLGTVRTGSDLGIVITASHNPPSYNGYKLKGNYGGPLLPEKIDEIEQLIPDTNPHALAALSLENLKTNGLVTEIDLERMYCEHVEASFDLETIRKSGIRIGYDAMFGAGQNVFRKLLPAAVMIRSEHNPGFQGQAPEPIHKNLQPLATLIREHYLNIGIATDGDADRIGIYDEQGNFIDSHHVILLLIKYLHVQKKMTGKVVTAFSVSPKVAKMCRHYGIEQQVTKVGFKHIAGIMVKEDALLGGEESGGIAIKGHIPERDGIWIGLTILEQMARSGKSLQQLIDDVYKIVGAFHFERSDLHLKEEVKARIVENCANNTYSSFGPYKVQRVETTDGYKYFFNDDEWFMIRASGTEPVLRNYAESNTRDNAFSILKAAEETLLQVNEPALDR